MVEQPSELDVDAGLRPRSLIVLFLTIGGLSLALAIAYVFWLEPAMEHAAETRGSFKNMASSGGMLSTPFIVPGIQRPPIYRPADAPFLADSAEVVGITVGDRHRAYWLYPLSFIGGHVVNDVIDEVPITVTYCDLCDSIAVFSSAERGQPIELGMNGLVKGRLQLRYRDAAFDQQTGENSVQGAPSLPLLDYPFERTRWKDWREAHADTDVYIGTFVGDPLAENAAPGRVLPAAPPGSLLPTPGRPVAPEKP